MDGYKTYLAAAGIVLTGVSAFLTGEADLVNSVVIVLNGLGLGALRNAKALNPK